MTNVSPQAAAKLRVKANGLEHHVLEWTPTGERKADASARSVVLVHGFMDAAGTWDRVAPSLAAAGYRVLAPDMRGFGEGARAPAGSYYHFPDYVADLAEIVQALSPGEPVALVGHSMGGTIGTLFAGAFPESVVRLANLEGLGPPDNPLEVGPIRMRRWIEELRAAGARAEASPMGREEASRRLVANHPAVPREVLEDRLPHLVRDVTGEDGTPRVMWSYDPLHRTTSPMPFFASLFMQYAKLVTCPVLFVSGGETGFHVPDEAHRLAAFAHVEQATLEGAGHMLHWTRPAELAALLTSFL